jgi:membrane-associated protease RseP (regulator of RpoE activity)
LGYLLNVVIVLGVLILMVVAHELGHFTAAKLTGIKVTEFFVGFGPRIWSFRRGETEYGFKWLLVGGYVKILGMNPDEKVSEEDFPRSYRGSPIWKRAVVILSGSLVHLVLALLLIFSAIWLLGIPVYDAGTTVADVAQTMPDGATATPAAAAGLEEGDRIVSVDGNEVSSWDELRSYIVEHPGAEMTLQVEREGEDLELRTRLADREDGGGYLGVSPRAELVEKERYGFAGSLGKTVEWWGRASYGVGYSFYRLFTPGVWKQLLGISQPGIDRPVTVVGASRIAGDFAEQGAFLFLNFLAFILLFLAYVNLLPLPPLDGGYLLVLLVEKLRGKEVDLRKLYPFAVAVLAFFGILFLLTLRLDITNPINLP